MPRAILFDLDDTLISAYSNPDAVWKAVIAEFEDEISVHLGEGQTSADLIQALGEHNKEFWSDPERHRIWRLKMVEAKRENVIGGLKRLNPGAAHIDLDFVHRLADRFTAYRTQKMHLFDGAHDLLDTLKARGVPLGLITNGAADMQRPKIERFDLAQRFLHIQIEGEMGFGKPEERAYLHAADSLGVSAEECWIIGDNLEWEVTAPAKLGFKTIWHDFVGKGLPAGHDARPHHIITALPQVLAIIDGN